jgi:tetratricopeptide (TPR) repeat protein
MKKAVRKKPELARIRHEDKVSGIRKRLGEKFFSNNKLIIVFFILASLLIYGNTIFHEYTVDDWYVTGKNEQVSKGIKAIPEIFVSRYHDMGKKNQFEYRPIVKVAYAIEYQIFGANPYINHFFNIMYYALNCILIFFILKKLLKNYNILFPFLITLLYLAHPIHTEVVNSLKNRDEILSFIGCLLALYYFVRYTETGKMLYIIAGVLFFWFALLSKSSAVAFMVLIPLMIRFFYDTGIRKIIFIFIILTAAYYLYRYLPKLYLTEPYREKEFYENPLIFERNMLIRIGSAFYVMMFYLKLLFIPHPLIYYYGYNMIPVVGMSNTWAVLGLLLYGFLFVYAIIKYKSKDYLSVSIIFFLIIMSMYSNLVKPAMGIVAERFMYIAVLPFIMIVVSLIFRLLKIDPLLTEIPKVNLSKLRLIVIIILIPYSLKVIARNTSWKDNSTLVANDINYAKDSFILNRAYATELTKGLRKVQGRENYQSRLDSIIFFYKRATEIYPDHADPWTALGQIYLGMKDFEKALPCFLKATEIHPDKFSYSFYNLAQCYLGLNIDSLAAKNYLRGIEIYPEDRGYYQLAYAYVRMGRYFDAITALKSALDLNPEYSPAFYSLGYCHEQLIPVDRKVDHISKAFYYYDKMLSVDPDSYSSAEGLGRLYGMIGRNMDAEYYMNLVSDIKNRKAKHDSMKEERRKQRLSEETQSEE